MKLKIVLVYLLPLFIVACGKSEEKRKEAAEQAQLAAMQIQTYQRNAVSEALTYMAGMKGVMAEYYFEDGQCLSSDKNFKDHDFVKKLTKSRIDEASHLKTFDLKDDCTINVTFKDNASAPDLKGETLTLKMTDTSGSLSWSCSFTGKNKKDLPEACR